MKQVKTNLIIQDGEVFVCAPIKAQCKPDYQPERICTEVLRKAINKRIEHCKQQLAEAYEKRTVCEVTNGYIFYAEGCFSVPAYEAMCRVLEKLDESEGAGYLLWDSVALFSLSRLELDQLFKAYVQYNGWDCHCDLLLHMSQELYSKENVEGEGH